MKHVNALILKGMGLDSPEELIWAYQLAGAQAQACSIYDLFCQRVSLREFDILTLCGGFSFMDHLGAGKILANRLKYKCFGENKERFFDHLLSFIEEDKYILGIGNGFQTLVSLGLLPGLDKDHHPQATFVENDSGKYERRWCHLFVNKPNQCPFLQEIDQLYLPLSCTRGKLLIKNIDCAKKILQDQLIALSYCNEKGAISKDYPYNPSASFMSCAALSNTKGNILGILARPEKFLSLDNHPQWPQMQSEEQGKPVLADGLVFFQHLVRYISNPSYKRLKPHV